MNDGAVDADITLQWCMMNPVHVLSATTASRVTNGRATRDNLAGHSRQNAGDGLVLGLSGMLHYAVGLSVSRDNVWTNSTAARGVIHEPMVETQTLMAVLAGGPYGPSDGVGSFNKSLIMRACRPDGVLLKADKPVTMMDSAFAVLPFEGPLPCSNSSHPSDLTCAVVNVWSTHSDVPGAGRYGYVLGLDLAAPFDVIPANILGAADGGGGAGAATYQVVEYWHGMRAASAVVATNQAPFTITPPPRSNNSAIITNAYYIFAPVLPASGWCYLGEPDKIVTASTRRVASVSESADGALRVCLVGSSEESIVALARGPSGTLFEARCPIPRLPTETVDGKVEMTCSEPHGCVCGSC